MAPNVRILQIHYSEETRASLDPAFEPLDNSGNERPDWFEYWPIRAFLAREELRDDTFYGFFSPKFRAKTHLTGGQVREFVARNAGADVVTFSPFPEVGAIHLNVFEHGETCHPGLIGAVRAFSAAMGMGFDPLQLVMDAGSTVYCNYFVARPVFWREWIPILEFCFRSAEDPHSPLHPALNTPTMHDGRFGPQIKIFLMERMVPMLLATRRDWKIANYPPYSLPPQSAYWLPAFGHVIALEALKRSYRATGDTAYVRAFREVRERLFETLKNHWDARIPQAQAAPAGRAAPGA